jgi:REP element-mobilizing transposase RayT
MERKQLRLKGWDYAKNGAYFITICTKDRKKILSKISVGKGLRALPYIESNR